MSGTQGSRPFDPYRTLQLHPAAPRDLIEGAYWLLVSARSPALSESHIEELNVAYAALLDAQARRSYDEGSAIRGSAVRRRGPLLRLFSAKTPGAGDYDDYYHVLRIDAEADSRIIRFAYDFWMHGLQGARAERERIEEAHRTLSNPLLRAQYDASAGIGASVPPTMPVPGSAPTAPQDGTAADTGLAAAAGQPDAAQVQPSPAPRQQPRPIEEAHTAATKGPVGNGKRPTVVPPMFARGQPAAGAVPLGTEPDPQRPPETATAPKQGLLRRIRLTSNGKATPAATAAGGITAATGGSPTPGAVDPRDARLLTLRADDVAAVPAASPRVRPPAASALAAARLPASPPPSIPRVRPPAASANAELVFTAGPRIGERIAIGAETLTLGSGETAGVLLVDAEGDVEPAHARIWWHGVDVIFHQLGPGDTLIGGAPLVVPLVMLEDGDDIQIGLHRMRFNRR